MKVAAALAIALVAFSGVITAQAQTLVVNDTDVLNFALQAECLAAAFWKAAATGQNLTAEQLGGGGPVIGAQKAVLQGSALQLAQEFSENEQAHLSFLRTTLGKEALPCPEINIGSAFNSYVNLTLAALQNFNPYAPFSPYKDFISLYFGGFILGDPEVFAYNGAATLLSNKTYIEAAAGILAVEGYHAGSLRENLATLAPLPTVYGINVTTTTNALAAVRAALQGADEDLGIANRAGYTLVDADGNALVFTRSVEQTLAFLYQSGNPLIPGGWFPAGVKGIFSPSSLTALSG